MKNQLPITLLSIFLAFILGITSCKKEEDGTTPTPTTNTTSCNVVLVTSNIDVPTTWSKDSIYIVETNVIVDATLTIQAGTIIKFKNGEGLDVSDGCIQAIGTAANPIIFTCYSDDNSCGDSNGDGTATLPTKGYWGGIKLNSNITSNLTYCSLLYSGGGDSNNGGADQALYVGHPSDGSTINHCTFAHTSGGLDNVRGTIYFGGEFNNCIFTNNVIYDNGSIICADYCATANFIDASNIFHNPNDASQKNVLQGIYLNRTNGGFFKNTQLHVSEVPYVLLGNDNGINSGIKVTLADGVILKFLAGAQSDIDTDNNSGFINSQGAGVLFTSLLDDTGGDSNGDGNLSSPANGDWEGIHDSNISGTDQWCHWSNIHYGSH